MKTKPTKRGPTPRPPSELTQSRTIRATAAEWEAAQATAKSLGLRGASELLRVSVRLVQRLLVASETSRTANSET